MTKEDLIIQLINGWYMRDEELIEIKEYLEYLNREIDKRIKESNKVKKIIEEVNKKYE